MKPYLNESMVLMSDYSQLMNVISIGLCYCWNACKAFLIPRSGFHFSQCENYHISH